MDSSHIEPQGRVKVWDTPLLPLGQPVKTVETTTTQTMKKG
jgi:hypothetical protein